MIEAHSVCLPLSWFVRDLAGMSPETLLAGIAERFSVLPEGAAVHPDRPGTFGMYLAGQWYRLVIQAERTPNDPVGRLDVSLLADNLLAPLLASRALNVNTVWYGFYPF